MTGTSALVLPLLLWSLGVVAAPAEAPPDGPLTQAECLDCHAERDPALVAQWRDGPHGGRADCVACHGERHGLLPGARGDAACTGCHGGEVAHSYESSKHGVIVGLERPAWERPLQRGAYRAPGCAYCHVHAADHGDTMAGERGPSAREWVCGGCHAPRFVADQFAAGDDLLAIGRLKEAEAVAVAARHPDGPAAVANLLAGLQRHLRNLRLGAGHQSPDYQWWHGQPALDADLIRLRGALAQEERRAALRAHDAEDAADPVQAVVKP
ncbi:MAG: multiheme c-type cytochrome [Pseudomonadota bacterium]|nr:multiheme c-type cytochrome [Pseudomonadota bacterium]